MVRSNPFTPEEDSYIISNWDHMKALEIAEVLNRSRSAISIRATHNLGLPNKIERLPNRRARAYNYKLDSRFTHKTDIKSLISRPLWFNEEGFEKKLTAGR